MSGRINKKLDRVLFFAIILYVEYNMTHIRQYQAISRCRQLLMDLRSERQDLEAHILARTPLVEGCLVEVHRVCGKPNCRCATSKKHWHGPYLCLSLSRQGKTRTIHLPKMLQERVRGGVKAARLYRQAHQRWRTIGRRLEELWKQVEHYRKQNLPYEPKKKSR